MKRLTYNFSFCGQDCWQVKGADNLECREVCESGDGCATCPIANAFNLLAEIENILGEEYDLAELAELVKAKREGQIREDIHGEWIQPDEPVVCAIKCSVCGETEYLDEPEQYKDWNFCPNCGARMAGGGER